MPSRSQPFDVRHYNREQLLRAQLVGKFGSWEVDFSSGVLSWSDAVFSIFEIAREEFGGTEEAFFALIHPEDRSEFLKAREDWLEGGGRFLFEHRIVTPSGTVKWVVERAEIIPDEDGKPLFTTGTVQDVTDLKEFELARDRAQAEASRQSRLVKLAGEIGKIGGWRYDVTADVLEWSEETARIHEEPEGFSPTPEQGIAYYTPNYRDRIRERFYACVNDGVAFNETLQIRTANDRLVWVRSIGNPVRDQSDAIVAVEGAFQDITGLVETQNEAAGLSERLSQTLENMSDAFYLLDNHWRFAFLNTKAEQFLQRDCEELLGQVVWDKFPEAAAQVRQPFELAVRENRMVRFEEAYPPLDRWFEVSAHPTPAGLAVYFRDITEDRIRDSQLRLLEASVAKLNDILLITEAEPVDNPGGPAIVYVNDAFERRTGYTREEVIGKTPRILQGPKTQRDELDRIRDALEAWQPVRSELINYPALFIGTVLGAAEVSLRAVQAARAANTNS